MAPLQPQRHSATSGSSRRRRQVFYRAALSHPHPNANSDLTCPLPPAPPPPPPGPQEACCRHGAAEESVLLLPLDLVGPPEELEAAAEAAFGAFGGQGVAYLVHNAGVCYTL